MTKYKKIKLPDGTTRDEHRLIMEQHLGRRLDRHEVVHHINGDSRDNRIENMQVMSLSEHSSLHFNPDTDRTMSLEGRERLSLRNRGEGHAQSKLTDVLVRRIRVMPGTLRAIGKQLGLSHVIVGQVKRRERWVHVV